METNKAVLKVEGENVGVTDGVTHHGVHHLFSERPEGSKENGRPGGAGLEGEGIVRGESGEEREQANGAAKGNERSVDKVGQEMKMCWWCSKEKEIHKRTAGGGQFKAMNQIVSGSGGAPVGKAEVE